MISGEKLPGIHDDAVAIFRECQDKFRSSGIRIILFIHSLNSMMENVFVEQESVFHSSLLLERVEIFREFVECLVKEARKSSLDLPLFVNL